MIRARRRFFLFAAPALLAPLVAGEANQSVTEIHLESGGIERTCLVHEPSGAAGRHQPMPLVLLLHGGGGTAEGMVRLTRGRFNELADRDGFLVAYPQGVGHSWNDGRNDIASRAHARQVDDVGFIRDLVAFLSRGHAIDRRQIFAAGMSNGGMMVLRLACSLPDTIRGVAAVGASLPRDIVRLCPARSAVSIFLIDGTADPIVPYEGGEVRVLFRGRGEVIGAAPTALLWAGKSGCRAVPSETNLPDRVADGTHVKKIEFLGCESNNRVTLYRVEGGGHAWPGGLPYLSERLIGRTSENISASDVIWQEFSSLK